MTFEYKVVDTVPHWVYCGQKLPNPHCQAGMVFAINPPKEGPNTFEAFLEKAKAAPLDAPTAAPLDARAAAPDHHSHKTIPVQVGGKPSRNAAPVLRYNPQTVHARAGDMVEFNFRANAHTVTQSSFEKPCEALKGGFKTGLQTNTKDIDRAILKQFKVADDKKPLWFYCGAPTHCQKGMVFAINDGGRFHEFQQRAMASAPK